MRILILGLKEWPYGISSRFEKYPGGGTAKYIKELVNKLITDNHKVILITRKFPGQKKYEQLNNLEIFRVPFINNKILRLPSFSFFSLFKALRLNHYDIIHAHLSLFILSGLIVSKIKKVPIVGTPHGSDANQWKGVFKFLFSIIEKWIYTFTNKIIFFSDNDKKKFEKLFNQKYKNSEIIHSGIQIPQVNKSRKFNNKFSILFVGRLVPVKRIDNIIYAVSKIDESIRNNIELNIVGEGYEKANLKDIVSILKLEEQITFAGFQKELEVFYSNVDLFILPSDSEGFPIALLEAMSYGVPCLINNFGLPISEQALFILKNNSVEEIKNKIVYLYNNFSEMQKVGEKALLEIKANFSIEKFYKDHLKLYNSLLQKNMSK